MRQGEADLHPNHLFYEHILLFFTYPLRWFFSIQQSIGILGAFTGAASLQIIYNILTQKFGVWKKLAFASTCLMGFSYTIWYYSVAIEIYIYTLFFLLLAFSLLLKPKLSWEDIVLCASLQSVAILFHQGSILFGFVAVVAILTCQACDVKTRIKMFLVYLFVGVVFVGFSYLCVASNEGVLDSAFTFFGWLIGNGSTETSNSDFSFHGFSFRNIFLMVVGFSRAIISIYFVLVNTGAQDVLQSIFSQNSLSDEIYLAQSISEFTAILLVIACFCLMIALLWVAVKGVRTFGLTDGRISQREFLLFLSWLLPYTLFFTVFNPSNVDFWMIQFVLVVMLLTIGLAGYSNQRVALTMVYLGAFSICMINGFGTILPAHNPDNDYYRQLVSSIDKKLSENDVLLVANAWPLTYHLEYYSDIQYTALSNSFFWKNLSTESVVEELESMVSSGANLYVANDVYDLVETDTEFSREEFPVYTRKVLQGFCAGEKTILQESWYIINVPCVQ